MSRNIRATVAAAAGGLVAPMLLLAPPASAAPLVVTNSTELVAAITTTNATPGPDVITVQGTIVLEEDLPQITDALVIEGDGGVVDGDLLFSGIDARHTDSLTVTNLSLVGMGGDAIHVYQVDHVQITGVTIDGGDAYGIYVYASGAGMTNVIHDVTVSGTRYDGVQTRLYHGASAQVDHLRVADSGRIEATSTPRKRGGVTIVAAHRSVATLTDVEYTETDPSRANGARFPGVVASAENDATITMSDVTVSQSDIGVQLTATESAQISLTGVSLSGHDEAAADIESHDAAQIRVTNFTADDSDTFAAALADASALVLRNGTVSNSRYEAAFVVAGSEEPDSTARVSVTDVAVLDAAYDGLVLQRVPVAELHAVTVARSANLGLGVVAAAAGSSVHMVNSTITDNAGSGVTVLTSAGAQPSSLTIESSTIADNTTAQITAIGPADPMDLTVRNSIVSGTHDSSVTPWLVVALHSSHSLWNGVDATLGDHLGSTGPQNLVDVDPQLAALADNGGSTPTRLLMNGSPAIDAGDGDAPSYAPDLDQRHVPRIIGIIDLGATEVGTLGPVGGDDDDDGPGGTPPDTSDAGGTGVDATALPKVGTSAAEWLMWSALGALVLGAATLALARLRAGRPLDG